MLLIQLDIGMSLEFLRGTQLLSGSPSSHELHHLPRWYIYSFPNSVWRVGHAEVQFSLLYLYKDKDT